MFDHSGLQAQGSGVRPAADSHQDLLGLEGLDLTVGATADHFGTHGAVLYGLHRAGQAEPDTHLLHVFKADGGQVPIQHGQDVAQSLYHRHLGAEGRIGTGQLQADDTAADDHHGLRPLLQREGPGGVNAVGVLLDARAGGHCVDRAGGQNHLVAGEGLLCAIGQGDAQLLGADEGGGAADPLDTVGLQQACHAAGELLAYAVFIGDDLGEVYPYVVRQDTQACPLCSQLIEQLGAVEQTLGGDAAHIQAGTADIFAFNQRDLCA